MKKTIVEHIKKMYETRIELIINGIISDFKAFDHDEPKLFKLSKNLIEFETLTKVLPKKKTNSK